MADQLRDDVREGRRRRHHLLARPDRSARAGPAELRLHRRRRQDRVLEASRPRGARARRQILPAAVIFGAPAGHRRHRELEQHAAIVDRPGRLFPGHQRPRDVDRRDQADGRALRRGRASRARGGARRHRTAFRQRVSLHPVPQRRDQRPHRRLWRRIGQPLSLPRRGDRRHPHGSRPRGHAADRQAQRLRPPQRSLPVEGAGHADRGERRGRQARRAQRRQRDPCLRRQHVPAPVESGGLHAGRHGQAHLWRRGRQREVHAAALSRVPLRRSGGAARLGARAAQAALSQLRRLRPRPAARCDALRLGAARRPQPRRGARDQAERRHPGAVHRRVPVATRHRGGDRERLRCRDDRAPSGRQPGSPEQVEGSRRRQRDGLSSRQSPARCAIAACLRCWSIRSAATTSGATTATTR